MADTKAMKHDLPVVTVTSIPQGQAFNRSPMAINPQTGIYRCGAVGSNFLIFFGIFFVFSGAVMTGMGYRWSQRPSGPAIQGPEPLRTIGPVFLSIGGFMLLSGILLCIFIVRKIKTNGNNVNTMNSRGINTGYAGGGPIITGSGTPIQHSVYPGAVGYHGGVHHGGFHHSGMSDHGMIDNSNLHVCDTGFSHGGGCPSGGESGFSSGGCGFSSGGGSDFSSGGGNSGGGDF